MNNQLHRIKEKNVQLGDILTDLPLPFLRTQVKPFFST